AARRAGFHPLREVKATPAESGGDPCPDAGNVNRQSLVFESQIFAAIEKFTKFSFLKSINLQKNICKEMGYEKMNKWFTLPRR
ncbi:MAG: hypothetical protein H5U18_13190, partial [Rhodobacteraceae bacterium]|nr:hypothetical protein [Paracoccaceae bacterium]